MDSKEILAETAISWSHYSTSNDETSCISSFDSNACNSYSCDSGFVSKLDKLKLQQTFTSESQAQQLIL